MVVPSCKLAIPLYFIVVLLGRERHSVTGVIGSQTKFPLSATAGTLATDSRLRVKSLLRPAPLAFRKA